MRQELHDALAASTLDKDRRWQLIQRFSASSSPEKLVGAFTEQHAAHLAKVISDAEAAQVAEASDPKTLLRGALDAAFYGTPTPRDPAKPETLGITRMGHAKDGWRDGVSHPFKATVTAWPAEEGPELEARKRLRAHRLMRVLGLTVPPAAGAAVTWDVVEDEPDETRDQYAALVQLIDAGTLVSP